MQRHLDGLVALAVERAQRCQVAPEEEEGRDLRVRHEAAVFAEHFAIFSMQRSMLRKTVTVCMQPFRKEDIHLQPIGN